MRAPFILTMGFVFALAGCQTANVTLLSDEDGKTVGKVAVLDRKTETERGEIATADTEVATGGRKVKPRKARKSFAELIGLMPRAAFERQLEFKLGTTEITDESKPALAELLDLWQRDRSVADVRIIGFADSTGEAAANMKLSQDRADAVKAFLINQGFEFKDDNSEVVGQGDAAARAMNGPGVEDARYRKVTVQIR